MGAWPDARNDPSWPLNSPQVDTSGGNGREAEHDGGLPAAATAPQTADLMAIRMDDGKVDTGAIACGRARADRRNARLTGPSRCSFLERTCWALDGEVAT